MMFDFGKVRPPVDYPVIGAIQRAMPASSSPDSGTHLTSISQGLPPGDRAQRATFNNAMLTDGQLNNRLLAGPQSGAPAQGMPTQAGPPGQQMTQAIAQHLASLPPAKVAQASQRIGYMVNLLGSLARKPNLKLGDVISAAGQSVADGKATPEEASAEIAGLPQDPKQLRLAIQQRFKAEIISASLLSGSQQPAPQQAVAVAPQMPPSSPAPGSSNMLIGGVS